jgi:hypothetical protein
MERHVFPRFGRMRLGALTRPMVEDLLVALPVANQTRKQILYALRVRRETSCPLPIRRPGASFKGGGEG